MAKNKDLQFDAVWRRRDQLAELGSKRIAKYWFALGQRALLQKQDKNRARRAQPTTEVPDAG